MIYELVRDMVQLEIDDPQAAGGRPTWRELALGACRQRRVDDDSLPSQDCEDLEEWDLLIQCLADGVLWDDDWKDTEGHLDADPETSRAVKKLLRIDEDYYVDVPPDPSDEELEEIIGIRHELTLLGKAECSLLAGHCKRRVQVGNRADVALLIGLSHFAGNLISAVWPPFRSMVSGLVR